MTYARSAYAIDRADLVDRARILAIWQSAASWVTGQLRTVRRIERSIARPQWEAAIRRALDRDDEPQEAS